MEFNSFRQAPNPSGFDFEGYWANTKSFLSRNKLGVVVIVLAMFLFYWFEIRPIRINNECMGQAAANARLLVQSKAEVATDPEKRTAYQNLVKKNMYLRSDYESFYKKCLGGYGIFL